MAELAAAALLPITFAYGFLKFYDGHPASGYSLKGLVNGSTRCGDEGLLPSQLSAEYPARYKILTMADKDHRETPGFLSGSTNATKEPRSWPPWIIAGAVIAAVIAVMLVTGRSKKPENPGGANLAPPDAYAASLPISNLTMSESGNLAGSKVTYIDGKIANHGNRIINGITVQVAFRNALGQITQKETMPLMLIRTHEPYIDTQPVSAAPIEPGEQREFRLIFDRVAEDWNQQYPEIRVIQVEGSQALR